MLKQIIDRFAQTDTEIPGAFVISALSKYQVDYGALLAAPHSTFYAEIYGAVVAYKRGETYHPRFARPDQLRNKLITAIPTTHLDALAITAAEAGISLSELIRRVIADAANN